MALLAAVLVVSVGMMIFHQIEYRKTLADTDEALRIAGLQTNTQTQRPEVSPSAEMPPEESEPLTEDPPGVESGIPVQQQPQGDPLPPEASNLAAVDLDALREYNEDIVGWIAIPGTVVSYPLVQGKDDKYYLTHNWKKESNSSGTIFLAHYASPDLTDFHTLVYGHHMQNETMFGTLKYYLRDPSYWQLHPSIYIVLDDVIYRYDIYAILDTNVYDFTYRLDIVEKHLEERFFQNSKAASVFDTGVTPKADDRVLSLSTCTTSNLRQTSRWVIQGTLAQEYRRAQ